MRQRSTERKNRMHNNGKTNGKALVSLSLACISLVCCIQWSISLVLAVLAIVFGILGLREENPNQEDAAIAGIVVGIVGLLLSVFVAMLVIYFARSASQQNLDAAVAVIVAAGPY